MRNLVFGDKNPETRRFCRILGIILSPKNQRVHGVSGRVGEEEEVLLAVEARRGLAVRGGGAWTIRCEDLGRYELGVAA